MAGSNINSAVSSTLWLRELEPIPSGPNGLALALSAACTGSPPTTANIFAHGCQITQLDTANGTPATYENTGTSAIPVWTLMATTSPGTISLTDSHLLVGNASNVAVDVAMSGDVTISNTGATTIGAAKVTGAKLSTGVGYFQVAKNTNGTSPVNVIAATVPFACTITGVYLISLDTTAGNITLADTAGTVCTIAKGATAGALVGATSLANTSVSSGNTLTIVSSSAGNATVFITFTVA